MSRQQKSKKIRRGKKVFTRSKRRTEKQRLRKEM